MSHNRWIVISEDCFNQLKHSVQTPPSPSKLDKKEVPEGDKKEVDPPPSYQNYIPPAYQSEAQRILNLLKDTGEFKTAPLSGNIIIKNQELKYPLVDFLRFTCVPFTQGTFPIEVQEWLRDKKVTQFMNHLAVIKPKWEPMYSFRKSTMARRPKAR
jgi:hypothetical protein